jgi:hypothetical protein
MNAAPESLLIFFDDVRGPDLGLVRILSDSAERTTLTEKVPALVELDFYCPQPGTLFLGQRLLGLEPMLLGHQFLDVPKH